MASVLSSHPLSPSPDSISVGPAIPSDILLLVGPILIGNLVGCLLLGVLTMQLCSYSSDPSPFLNLIVTVDVYYICFPKDRWWIKFSAYGLYLLDLVQTVLVTNFAWTALCEGWGNTAALMHTDWCFSMTPIVGGMISGWVQIFFAWRVWAVGHSSLWKAVTAVIVAIAVAQAGTAIALGIKFAYINDLNKLYEVKKLIPVALAGCAIADCLIAASMIYFLASASRKHMWNKSTNKRITNLIRSMVETGVLSAAAAFLDLGLFMSFPQYNFHIGIAMMLSKLYSNALMASLNSRAGVYERLPASSSRGEDTSGYFNTVRFTSVGIPVAADDTVCMTGTAVQVQDGKPDGEQMFKMKAGRFHAGIPMVNRGAD